MLQKQNVTGNILAEVAKRVTMEEKKGKVTEQETKQDLRPFELKIEDILVHHFIKCAMRNGDQQ